MIPIKQPPMPDTRPDPVQPADAAALALVAQLRASARTAALAVIDPTDGSPGISRIALAPGPDGAPLTLISALSAHHAALCAHPACALMLGEVAEKGDPLTHPRLMLKARATFVAPDDPTRPTLRDHWLALHPKARLYIDFSDFSFVRFTLTSGLLNAGFARAHRLSAEDLA